MKNANTRQHDDSLLTVLGMTATGRPMSWQPSKVGRLRAGRLFVTCGLAVFVASASFANLVSNGSFENGTFRYGQNPSNDFSSAQVFAGSSDIAGWTITAAAGNDVHWAENGNGFGWITPFGSRMIDLSGWSDVNNGAVMSQDFGAVGGQQYQVDFEIGVDSGLTQGGSVSIAAGIGGSTQSTTLNLPIGWSGVYWEHRTMVFTALNNNDPVNFQGLYSPFCIGLDDVSVEAVPEPATLVALGTGLTALAARRRRKA